MGDKSGMLFNMITVVIVAGILIGAMVLFFPEITTQITDGAKNFVTEGFKKSTLVPSGS